MKAQQFLWCVLLGAAVASTAFAQTAPPTQGTQKTMPPSATTVSAPADTFSTLDADKDGRVSSTEAAASGGFDSSFSSVDANADGFVTSDEYTAHADSNKQP